MSIATETTLDAGELLERMPELAPLDEHNRGLLEHVHPPAWVNPKPSGRYNLVVIGAGTAGLVTAAGAAGLGAKVALVERRLMGGDCLNVGCVPSKALIRCARAAAAARHGEQLGVRVRGDVEVDFPFVMERMRRLRSGISGHDSASRFSGLGVDVFIGEGSFVDPQRIKVGDVTLEFSRAVVATGGKASAPPVPGLEEAGYLTNETLFSLTELPRRLAVIGGGPIGCEMAQAFARFGSQVTLIEATEHILPREDREAASVVHQSLERDGVRIICGGKTASVRREGEDKVVETECGGSRDTTAVDEILVAVGRKPNVEGLGLDAAGVEHDPKVGVTVNGYLQTTNPKIYAAGDVCSKYKFTHAADAMARIVIQNALFFGRAKADRLVIPWCTYTDPELAHAGMYPEEADREGIEAETIRIGFDSVDRAVLDGETEGLLKVLVANRKGRILGATLVAGHAGDMIGEMSLAMTAGHGLGTLAKTIHPYPTQAEAFRKAGDAFNRSRLTPLVKSLFTRLLAWRR